MNNDKNEYFVFEPEIKTVCTFRKEKDMKPETIINGIRCVDLSLEGAAKAFASVFTNTYDIFYNTNKYKSIEEAEKDVYKVELIENKFKIIDPNNKEYWLELNYKPICGVDVLDDRMLENFISKLIKEEK